MDLLNKKYVYNEKTGPDWDWFYPANSLSEFLVKQRIGPTHTHTHKVTRYDSWILIWMDLELCTRDGRKNWPVKGLFHPANSLPEFFDLWGRDLVPQKRWKIRACFGTWTVFIGWMDLELWTRDGCKNRLVKGWFHLANSLGPHFLDLWCRDLVPQKRWKMRTCFGTRTLCMCWMDQLSFVQEIYWIKELTCKRVGST